MTNIEKSLRIIGKNEELRNKFISFIKEVEVRLSYNGSVRDDVTRYLVDALFGKDDFVIKPIQSGLKYKFSTGIGSKIAREFLLSTPEIPEFAWSRKQPNCCYTWRIKLNPYLSAGRILATR